MIQPSRRPAQCGEEEEGEGGLWVFLPSSNPLHPLSLWSVCPATLALARRIRNTQSLCLPCGNGSFGPLPSKRCFLSLTYSASLSFSASLSLSVSMSLSISLSLCSAPYSLDFLSPLFLTLRSFPFSLRLPRSLAFTHIWSHAHGRDHARMF